MEFESLDSFEQLMIDGELRKRRLAEIKKCLHDLPKCQREVILLKFFNELSYSEISEIMNLQLSSVYNLVSKAIEQLRQNMQFKAIATS
jgi:RNA polymerase sigma factor (sigma-70 family)